MRPAPLPTLAALVVALAIPLSGCGGDDDDDGGSDGGGGSSSGQEARETVNKYFKAVVAGDSEEACSTYLTKAGVTNVYGQDTCKGVVDVVPGPVRIASVDESGDSPTVVVFLSPGDEDKRTVTLQDDGGSLKIDSIERSP